MGAQLGRSGCQRIRVHLFVRSAVLQRKRSNHCPHFLRGGDIAQHIALYAFEALLTKLKFARKQYVASVRAGVHHSSYSAETAGDHFALAWVNEVHGKLSALVPKGEDDIPGASDGRDIIAVEAQDKALITEYLANKGVGKTRKARDIDIDLNAQIAGMLVGRRVDLHAGIARGGEEALALTATN